MSSKYFAQNLLIALVILIVGLTSNCFAASIAKKTIYVATAGGVSISTDNGKTFDNKPLLLVNGVYVDNKNVIYAATGFGLAISKDQGESFDLITTDQGLGDNEVHGVYVDTKRVIYAATFYGLAIKGPLDTTFHNKTVADGLGGDYVTGVYVDKKGTIYASSSEYLETQNEGISISPNKDAAFHNIAAGLGSADVNGIFTDNTGTIYAATKNGLAIGKDDGKPFDNITKDKDAGLGGNDVTQIFVDNSGVIYAATNDYSLINGAGIAISKNGGKSFDYKQLQSLFKGDANSVYVDSDGIIYVGTGNGLYISTDHGKSFERRTTYDKLGSNYVTGVFVTKDPS